MPERRHSATPGAPAHALSIAAIYRDPRFWRLAPLSATCIGSAWALQGLWAAPWLTDVEELERPVVVTHLLIMALALTIGLLTPPVGMVLYALVRVTGLSFADLVRVSFPYVILLLALTAVLILLPDLTLFLPRLLGYADAN